MYIWKHTYTDYNGKERTEDFHFNLSKGECMDMEMSSDGGMTAYIQRIINEQSQSQLYAYFKDVVVKSYGKKSLDGRQFVKNEAQTQEFLQTEAFSDLMVMLVSNADKAAEFFNHIIPKVKAS